MQQQVGQVRHGVRRTHKGARRRIGRAVLETIASRVAPRRMEERVALEERGWQHGTAAAEKSCMQLSIAQPPRRHSIHARALYTLTLSSLALSPLASNSMSSPEPIRAPP